MPPQNRPRLLADRCSSPWPCRGLGAAGRAFGRGESAARAGDWDAAVEHYRRAVQEDPDSADYRIALERAMITRVAACTSIRRGARSARSARGRAARIPPRQRVRPDQPPDRRQGHRDGAPAPRSGRSRRGRNRPSSSCEQAAQTDPEPLLNPASTRADRRPLQQRQPARHPELDRHGDRASTSRSSATSRTACTRCSCDGVTLEQALNQILAANQLFYKVVNERTIMVSRTTRRSARRTRSR